MENNIIITGAAQRLGLDCALTLQQAGYQVIATYRSEKPGLKRKNPLPYWLETWEAKPSPQGRL